MPTSYAEIMQAITRLEDVLYGDPSRDKKGIVEKVNSHEDFIKEIRDIFRKILWAAIIGALSTIGTFFLNTRSLVVQQQQQHQTQQPK